LAAKRLSLRRLKLMSHPSRPGPNSMPLWILMLAAVFAVDAVAVGASLSKPISLDYSWFLRAGESVAESGVPFVYVGTRLNEDASTTWRLFGDATHELGLWHPPAYVYSLGAVFRLFGNNDLTARLPGIVSIIGTTVVTVLLSRRISRWRNGDGVGVASVLAAMLLLLNPLTVQYAVLLPDIDGTILTFLTVLLVYLLVPFADHPEKCSARTSLALAALFAALLWTKLTTPPLVLGACALFYALRRNLAGLRLMALVGGAGVLIFLVSWMAYCWALGLPPLYPVEQALARSTDLSPGVLAAFAQGFRVSRFDVTWLGLPLAILYAWGVLTALVGPTHRDGKGNARRLVGVIVAVGFATYTFLVATSGLFPRYIFPLFPLAAVLAADAAAMSLQQLRVRPVAIALLLIAIVGIVLPDRLLVAWGRADVFQIALSGRLKWAVWALVLVLPMIVVALVAGPTIWRRWRFTAPALIALATLAFAPENALLMLKQSLAPYETTYVYGRRGMPEAVAFLHRNYSMATDMLYAGPDVGYYWQGQLIDERFTRLPDVLAAHAANVLVFSTEDFPDPQLQALGQLSPRARFEDFYVYQVN
jgi:hypothetical protein